MSRTNQFRCLVAITTGLLIVSVAAFAQNPAQPRRESKRPNIVTTKKVPTAAPNTSRGDAQIAACVIIENNNEIALSQWAGQKSQNAEVKDFAQRMVQDHEQFVNQLQQFAAAGGYDIQRPDINAKSDRSATGSRERRSDRREAADRGSAQPGAPRTEGTAQAPRRTEGARETVGATSEQGLDFIKIKQEISQKCLQSARQALEEKSADKFDKCYIGGQVMMHMAMVDALEVLKNHSTGELSSVLADGLKSAQAHLDEAKHLEKNLEDSSKNK